MIPWLMNWIIFWIESADFFLNWIIFWIESWAKQYWIEYWMNHFLAKFKNWIESDWVSDTTTLRPLKLMLLLLLLLWMLSLLLIPPPQHWWLAGSPLRRKIGRRPWPPEASTSSSYLGSLSLGKHWIISITIFVNELLWATNSANNENCESGGRKWPFVLCSEGARLGRGGGEPKQIFELTKYSVFNGS